MSRSVLRAFFLIVASVGLAVPLLWQARASSAKERTTAPATSVVLIVVDTERADYVSPNGAGKAATPFLATLAQQGVTFKNAYSTAPWTVPAMASLFTGLYPPEHGMTTGTLASGKSRIVGQQVLSDRAQTLAELLKAEGYATFGINTNMHLSQRFGFGQGFDHYLGESFQSLPYPLIALDSLAPRIRAASKYFLWLHLFDPHLPYVPEAPWFDRLNDSGLRSFPDFMADIFLREYRHRNRLGPNAPIAPKDMHDVFEKMGIVSSGFAAMPDFWLRQFRAGLSAQQLRFIKAAYRSEIRQTDDAVAAAMERIGADDQTLIIATSDHGEELLERGRLGHHHTTSLYQELLRVPLVIRFPKNRFAGTVVQTPVSLIDVMPTILEVVGIEPLRISGKSLVPLIVDKQKAPHPLYAQMSNTRGQSGAIIDHPWKYATYSDIERATLFNLVEDPGELDNLIDEIPGRALAMHKRLNAWIKRTKPRWPGAEPAELNPKELDQLRQLGYVE